MNYTFSNPSGSQHSILSPVKCHNAISTLPTSMASTGEDDWANGIMDNDLPLIIKMIYLTLKLTSLGGKKSTI